MVLLDFERFAEQLGRAGRVEPLEHEAPIAHAIIGIPGIGLDQRVEGVTSLVIALGLPKGFGLLQCLRGHNRQ